MPTFLYPRTIELMVLGPSDSELTAVGPRFSGLWIRAKFFHWVSRFSIMKKETLELLRLHKHVTQFLQFSLYICVCVCVCVYNIHIYACMLSHFSHVWLFATPWTAACQAPLSMEFSRQEYWNGFPFPPPRDLPNSGIELASPAFQADSQPMSHRESHIYMFSPVQSSF